MDMGGWTREPELHAPDRTEGGPRWRHNSFSARFRFAGLGCLAAQFAVAKGEEVIKALPKILLALTGVAALSIAYPASVQAVPTTYTYTGNPFTSVSGPYTTSDFVSGMVTLAGPLAANMPFTLVSPIAFSFSDGVQTITPQNDNITNIFFATGPTAAITAWHVAVGDGSVGATSLIATQYDPPALTFDEAVTSTGSGENRDSPGRWEQVVGFPEAGSTLSLMTLTLMALGVAARRFKRAVA
jgi:hypothetical protein